MDIQFDYVTGVLFLYTMGIAGAISAACFIALFALRRADNKRIEGEIQEVKQLWLDSNGRRHIK